VGPSPESIEPPSGAADPVIVLGARLCGASRTAWCERVRGLLAEGAATAVICDVAQLSGPATDVLDTLASLQLTAQRCGGRIRLRNADVRLVRLLELTGLAVVLPVVDEPEQ
jgi:anti-anti-sigma regulatory factor